MAFSTHDIVSDSPTNNFATLNPIDPTTGSPNLEDGNLKYTAGTGYVHANGTFFLKSGKWYFEFHPTTELNSSNKIAMIGFREKTNINEFYYRNDGLMFDGTSSAGNSTYNTLTARDVIGCYLNLDDNNGEITFYKNGSVENGSPFASNIFANLTTKAFVPFTVGYDATSYANFGQDPTFGGNKNTPATVNGVTGPFAPSGDAEGTAGLFYYPPPADALALCTANLPDFTPTVGGDTPQDYFKAVTYSGNGGTQSITGVGFQPDLVWIKTRNATANHALFDSIRGVGNVLQPNTTLDAQTDNNTLTSFDSNGFSLGNATGSYITNTSTYTFVGWCVKAGGAPTADNTATSGAMNANGSAATSSNSSVSLNGTLQSNYTPAGSPTIYPKRMSINTDAGFSIVKYTGTGSSATVPHGLSSAPDLRIIKGLDTNTDETQHWFVWSAHSGSNAEGRLDLTNVFDLSASTMNGDSPVNSNTFPIGSNARNNQSGKNYIAYCWHSVEGYSKFGSYTGNGSADGPFVYCGFRVGWLMYKRTDTTGNWAILDNKRNLYNVVNNRLFADEPWVESDLFGVADFTSNGFKIRTDAGSTNATNGTYIFMAFAEQPFKFSNAR